jgi:hypothetical protein
LKRIICTSSVFLVILVGYVYWNSFGYMTVSAQPQHAPIAVVVPEVTAYANEIVTLSGNKSYDTDGDRITSYSWGIDCTGNCECDFVNPDAPGSLSCSAEGSEVSVQLPNLTEPKDLKFNLVVSDGKYTSNPPAPVVIHVLPMELAGTISGNTTQ